MRLSRKGWVLMTTTVVIALVFAFYFLVYVKNRESQIIANKMRVLTQIKGNIDLLITSEKKIRENQKSKVDREIQKIVTEIERLMVSTSNTTNSEIDEFNKNIESKQKDINDILKSTFQGWFYITQPDQTQDFLWEKAAASWKIGNNFIYKKPYHELFGKELIERKDEFEFIALAVFGNDKESKDKGSILFSNYPLGRINFPLDSTFSYFTSKNVFEIDFGNAQYQVFSSYIAEYEEGGVYLLGFVNKSQYNEEKREVSVFVITIAIILVTLIILASPLLKLLIMSNAERLGGKDVFLAGLSLVLAPAVLIMFFLFFTTNLLTDKEMEETNLENLHDQLASNFKEEITHAVDQLKFVNKQLPANTDNANTLDTIPFFKKLDSVATDGYYKKVWENDDLDDSFRYFNSIFWTDQEGNIQIYLSSETTPNRIGSLKHRNYVMDIVTAKTMDFNGEKIAFESIRSVSDGNYEMGLGIASSNPNFPVLATSFSMASLTDPILEEGYGFCFFNKEGLTMFHSETKRNLNEDFLKETDEVFNPFILSGISHFTSVGYMGKKHYMYLKPIPDMEGYHLATFLDKAYIHSPNALALNLTAEMQGGYLLLLFIAYFILFIAVCRRKKLKQRIFLFYWIRPMVFSEGQHSPYTKLLLINIIVFLYLLVSLFLHGYCFYSPEFIIHTLLLSGLFLIVVNFWVLSDTLPEKERFYTLFNPIYSSRTIGVIIILYAVPFLIGRILLLYNSNYRLFLGDILVTGLIIYLIYKILRWPTSDPIFKFWGTNDFFLDYKLYATSLVVFFSVIPTIIFFSINYKMEQEILFKQKAATLNERIENWKSTKAAQFYEVQAGIKTPIILRLDDFIEQMTFHSLGYAISDSIRFDKNFLQENPSTNCDVYTDLFLKSRVEFDEYGMNSQGFIPNAGNSWTFSGNQMYFTNSKTSRVITAPIKNFGTLFLQNWWVMALFFILLILLIYWLLNAVIYKAFGLGFKEYADNLVLPKNYQKIGEMLVSVYSKSDVHKDSFNNSFIVGVNASHVYEIYHYLEKWKGDGFYSVELLDLPNLINQVDDKSSDHPHSYFANKPLNFQISIQALIKSSHNNYTPLFKALNNKHIRKGSAPIMVFIEHFEYAYDNELLNRIKLNLLQRLVSNPSIRVVISSEISPTKIYEFFEDRIKKAITISSSGAEKSLENREKIEVLKSEYKQWQNLLGGFYRITLPIEYKDTTPHPIDFLEKELEHGHYLHRIHNKYKVLYTKMTYCEDYILNVQETSYTYYFAIWNSLTKEERYIVYDIAHDQFVNTNNVDGIIDLLHKGILVYKHSLRLMNESFTNFVLTKVDSDEALERELELNKHGNWSTASAVLLLVIISLIVFISFGKTNILEDMNALLTSLVAIFALLLRVGGIFITGKPIKE